MRTGAGFIFQAVTDAAAALTLSVTDLPSNAPFDAVQPQLDALARAGTVAVLLPGRVNALRS